MYFETSRNCKSGEKSGVEAPVFAKLCDENQGQRPYPLQADWTD